jgi:hypothetical protein
MKKLLGSLSIATKHISILDDVFRKNYPPYTVVSKKLEGLPLYDDLRKEIYAGGKKQGAYGYGRQMILGDSLQYIFTGRGYYFAVRGKEQRESFISMIMYVCNLLILMEDMSVEVRLLNIMLDAFKEIIWSALFEDDEQQDSFNALRAYKGLVTPEEGEEYDNIVDSMLPKRVGVIPELLVYVFLTRKNYGYVAPLLHSQRLIGNQGYIVPPDFLLLRSKGEIFGIEVGKGKEQQMGSFSTITSIPVFTTGIGSFEQPQPYRCGRCLRWIIYCDEVVRLCSRNEEPEGEYVDCAKCSTYKGNMDEALSKCPHVVYHGRALDYYGRMKTLRYHYNCIRKDPEVPKVLKRARTPKLMAPLPWVSGLGYLSREV